MSGHGLWWAHCWLAQQSTRQSEGVTWRPRGVCVWLPDGLAETSRDSVLLGTFAEGLGFPVLLLAAYPGTSLLHSPLQRPAAAPFTESQPSPTLGYPCEHTAGCLLQRREQTPWSHPKLLAVQPKTQATVKEWTFSMELSLSRSKLS